MTPAGSIALEDSRRHLLSAMSHELRTPLNLVIGFADALARDPARPSAEIGALADAALQAAHQLMEAVNTAIEVTRVSQGLLELQDDVIDVACLLDACGRAIAPRAQAAGIRIEIEAPSARVMLRADERRLRQALDQLLGQAVAATRPGGRVRLGAARGDFGTLDLTVSGVGEADGMALDLSRSLVRGHGGALVVARGIATISLPAARLGHPSLTDQLQDMS